MGTVAVEEESSSNSEGEEEDDGSKEDVAEDVSEDECLQPVVVRVEMSSEEKLEDLGENRDVIFQEGHCLPKVKEESIEEEGEDTVEIPASLEANDVVGKIVTETLDDSLSPM